MRLFLLLFILISSLSSFTKAIDLVSESNSTHIDKVEINGIKYIKLADIENSISIGKIWFNDRNKMIVKLKNSERIIFTIDNPFIAYKSKNYNLIYDVKRNEKGEILIPYITFINLLPNLFGDIVKFDKSMSTIEFAFKDTVINNASFSMKDNGAIISLKIPKKTIFDYTFVNNSLNINFYEKKLDEKSITEALSKIERIKKIKVFNFKTSSQLSFQFKTLKEKPKLIFNKKNHEISVIIRTKKVNYSYRKSDKKKDKKKKVAPKKEKKIDMSLKKKSDKPFTLVIDAGHGGKDPGAIGWNSTKEKRIVLDVAKKLKKEFAKDKIKVILTRSTDKFIRLKNRAKIANKNHADLFISLHCNAIGGSKKRRKTVMGFSTYFLSPARSNDARAVEMFENSALDYEDDEDDEEEMDDFDFMINDAIQTKFLDESNYISEQIFEKMNKNGIKKVHGTGISQAGFYVLRKAFMPSILFEMGFISNPTEEKKLNSSKYQAKITKSLYEAVMSYKDKFYEQ